MNFRGFTRVGRAAHIACLLLGVVALLGLDVVCQTVTGDGAQAGKSLSIGGRRMTCGRGNVVVDNKMSAIGRAWPGKMELYLNMRRLRRYPPVFQQFVFLHECAHMTIRDETNADCWAIQRGRYRGLFTKKSVAQICKSLWTTPSGQYHFAGPDRCQHLNACWAKAGSQ